MPRFAPSFELLPPPSPFLQASVIIPARDEEHSICQTLDSLAHSCDGAGRRLDSRAWEVLLLCNNCRDETAVIARTWAARRPHLAIHVVEGFFARPDANIGTVRRALMDAACLRLESLPHDSQTPRFIASTDADTRVERSWLWANECEIRAGADAVGGRILVETDGNIKSRKTYLCDTAYRLLAAQLESKLDPQPSDPWPRHFQFFGASLCLTPRAYRAVGGVPRVPYLEDMALERELVRADVPIRRSPRVRVRTSARESGRVACGLSTQLREWNDLEQQAKVWLVPSGEEIAWKTRLRRRLHAVFGAKASDERELENLARALNLCPTELSDKTHAATHFGALWDDVWNAAWSNPNLRAQWSPVPVGVALSQMRSLLAQTH
ncbi:hypothetical protein IAD21_02142 [Abditibacteriota bacterium]|nr:hypothetical protein IAD21_02142 [Abditibacteriota bacterium]